MPPWKIEHPGEDEEAAQMTRDDVLLNDVYFTSYNMNHQPLTPLTPISKVFASFDGIHSGVPTKTTATLTPTTLKNIEQTFMELTNDNSSNIPCQAGFVPPPFHFEDQSQDRENSRESMDSGSHSSWQVTPPPMMPEDMDSKSSSTSFEQEAIQLVTNRTGSGLAMNPTSATNTINGTPGSKAVAVVAPTPATTRRNMGGRRPTKPSNLTPEEEEKRRVRRERNKQAAARCRRRREDHTNELVDETDQLEKKKQALQDEIKQLQQEKEDLEFLLESHREHCRFQGRRSPLERKPAAVLIQPPQQQQQQHQILSSDLKIIPPIKIKAEPEELPDQPPMKKLTLSTALTDSLDTPTPTSVAPVLTSVNLPKEMLQVSHKSGLNTPTISIASSGRPARPASLNVRATTSFPMLNVPNLTMDAGIGISTPSSGLFNFDSLMDGGTGLTPIAAPISLQSNRGPLDLITPTSTEPSKLCSL